MAMVQSYGFQVSEADCGQKAITLMKEQNFDMVFMDHMMPVMDGMEAAKRIRLECGENGREAVIIALTANVVEGAKELYLENGFQDFLAKPFERMQLHEVLSTWVPKRKKNYTSRKLKSFEDKQDCRFCCFNSLDQATSEDREMIISWIRSHLGITE